jgi:DNA-binding IclR family transcriptional regulator
MSTAHRLASELVRWGGLERADGHGYRIGLRLWEIGSLAPRGETLRSAALPVMHALYESTHENVHLAIREGHEALYIEKIDGPEALPVRSRRGGRLPLHATGVGKVLLAHAPEDVLETVLTRGLERYTPRTIVAPRQLKKTLQEVRTTGLAFAFEELTVGSVTVAAPIICSDGQVIAALDVVLHSGRQHTRRLAPAVRTSATMISRTLQQRSAYTILKEDR